ncbi:LOW QUALITY PROTEIN: NSFL1 cofactor p47 [Choristoneura fumiferana]|uniref:LOW QUALITY PROTEIN: NSFL1 cofactor p47 n=1 Tax=Choristoneura fumiferana TaxID=7141 RepID=UPI003D15771A
MSANKEDTLRQFCDVTGADEGRSRFFLESSNWQLDVALSSFYEHGGSVDEAPIPTATPASMPVLSDSDMESPPGSPLRQKKEKKKPASGNFATLDSLQQESSSDEDEGQAFYAGGSERSGQQIIGPGKNRKDIVTEMFKSVRERGAVVFEDEPATASRGRGAFSGTGYRLGQTADDHEPVAQTGPGRQGGGGAGGARSVRLRLYREGYTVDAGAVRPYTDPDHAEFLNCIRRGEIPPELSGAGEVRVSLEDRRHEPAPRASAAPQAFAGKGHMLGSPTPAVVGAPAPAAAPATPAAAEPDREANTAAAQEAVGLDTAQPITTIQFRLADGSRVAGRFNHAHTVADLRAFVRRAHPGPRPFALLTSFPSAELSDEAVTVAQANLLNSTLLQRLK